MKEQKWENGLMKENEQMNRQPAMLSDDRLQQVSGGGRVVPLDGCRNHYDAYCGKTDPCRGCPYMPRS